MPLPFSGSRKRTKSKDCARCRICKVRRKTTQFVRDYYFFPPGEKIHRGPVGHLRTAFPVLSPVQFSPGPPAPLPVRGAILGLCVVGFFACMRGDKATPLPASAGMRQPHAKISLLIANKTILSAIRLRKKNTPINGGDDREISLFGLCSRGCSGSQYGSIRTNGRYDSHRCSLGLASTHVVDGIDPWLRNMMPRELPRAHHPQKKWFRQPPFLLFLPARYMLYRGFEEPAMTAVCEGDFFQSNLEQRAEKHVVDVAITFA